MGGGKKKQNALTNFGNWGSKAITGKTMDEWEETARDPAKEYMNAYSTNTDSITQNEYDSLVRKSGQIGIGGITAKSLLKSEEKIGQRRKILGRRQMAKKGEAKTLIAAIRHRENQLAQSRKMQFGQQTGRK